MDESGRLPRGLQSREQQGNEQTHDRDHDQNFDERHAPSGSQ
jgi:hypothetical protein